MDDWPSYPWYPGDWQRDTGVQLCSLAARGLWREMLDLMWTSPERGVLLEANGNQMSSGALARLVRSDEVEVQRLLAELEAQKVFSKDAHGRVYSRRMIRDEVQRRTKAAAGKKGMQQRWHNKPITDGITDGITDSKQSDNSRARAGVRSVSVSVPGTKTPPTPPSIKPGGGASPAVEGTSAGVLPAGLTELAFRVLGTDGHLAEWLEWGYTAGEIQYALGEAERRNKRRPGYVASVLRGRREEQAGPPPAANDVIGAVDLAEWEAFDGSDPKSKGGANG